MGSKECSGRVQFKIESSGKTSCTRGRLRKDLKEVRFCAKWPSMRGVDQVEREGVR